MAILGNSPKGLRSAGRRRVARHGPPIDDVRAWIENPRPFMWTKTAEEILDSLANYFARISGT